MASHVYTLPELVDIALQTPVVGAVNFNILRIILHKIISNCKLQDVTAEWKPLIGSIDLEEILDDKNLPDHPILRRFKKDEDKDEKSSSDEKEADKEISSTEKSVQTLEPVKIIDVPTEDKEVETVDLKQYTETEKTEAASSEDSEVNVKTPPKKKVETSIDTVSKSLKVGIDLKQMWQMKKMRTRIEALEEALSSVVEAVDELQEFKESKMKRIRFEEGEKLASGYSGALIGRQEFEDTVDELGEALTRVSIKQRQQKDESLAVNEDILKEVCLKASCDDLTHIKDTVNRKLRSLGLAVKKIQKLLKDVIYPEACGISKCISCRRKAYIPMRYLIMGTKKRPSKKGNSDEIQDRVKKIPDRGSPAELKFTHSSLKRSLLECSQFHMDEKYHPEDHQIEYPERPVYTEYLTSLETFSNVSNLSRDFAPLRNFPDLMRRSAIYVPTICPSETPVAPRDTDGFVR